MRPSIFILNFHTLAKSAIIGGILGYLALGPLGALAGIVLGAIYDHFEPGFSGSEFFKDVEDSSNVVDGQRNGFLFSLMVLSSYVIQADGRIMHSEMEYVRQFLRRYYGDKASQEGNEILMKLFEQRKQETPDGWKRKIAECCQQLALSMPEEQRLQLMAFMANLAQADQQVLQPEIDALYELAAWLQVGPQMVDQLRNIHFSSLDQAYQLLGITPSATDDEVRAAYRQMALKYHPDRVSGLGDDVRRSAEDTFKQMTEAKDRIFAARGLK